VSEPVTAMDGDFVFEPSAEHFGSDAHTLFVRSPVNRNARARFSLSFSFFLLLGRCNGCNVAPPLHLRCTSSCWYQLPDSDLRDTVRSQDVLDRPWRFYVDAACSQDVTARVRALGVGVLLCWRDGQLYGVRLGGDREIDRGGPCCFVLANLRRLNRRYAAKADRRQEGGQYPDDDLDDRHAGLRDRRVDDGRQQGDSSRASMMGKECVPMITATASALCRWSTARHEVDHQASSSYKKDGPLDLVPIF
jgi:hypothetical protein